MTDNIFSKTLGLASPWKLDRTAISDLDSRVDMFVTFSHEPLTSCSECGSPMHITGNTLQSWKHTDFFNKTAYIHATIPEIKCTGCACEVGLSPPWVRTGSKFSKVPEKE